MWLWLSRDQRWSFIWISTPGQTVWQCNPCIHSIQPEQTLDKVTWYISSKIGYIKRRLNNFRFQSDDNTNGKGFNLEYKALQLITSCGANSSNASGVLSSPSHPNPYPHLADCVYLISQPNGTYVNISFLSMDIDCQGTLSDYIEMRDGYSEDSPLMARFCGNGSNVPDFIQTTKNHLRIR